MTSDLHAVVDAVRHDGRQRTMRCPAHDDHTASLSVGPGAEGRIVLTCHANCERDAILKAAALTWADLSPQTAKPKKTISAIYDYTDEHGALLYQVVRYTPKDFRQRRPDGHNGWTWKLGNVRRVLFGLPTLVGQTTVYIAEGERDVLALRQLGLAATCNAGGAGKWRDDYTSQLVEAGCRAVVILPDNDAPGRQHAEQVATSCRAACLAVTVVNLAGLPEHGDVTDWLEDGHTRDDLMGLANGTAPCMPSASDRVTLSARNTTPSRNLRLTPASAIMPKPVRWLWDGRVALGTLNLLGGREGIGKSIVECTLAADITRGRLPGIYEGTPREPIR